MKKTGWWDKFWILLAFFLFIQGMGSILSYLIGLFPIEIGSKLVRLPLFVGPFNLVQAYLLVLYVVLFLIIVLVDHLNKNITGKKMPDYGLSLPRKGWSKLVYFTFLLMPLAFLARLVDPGYDTYFAQGTGISTFAGLLVLSAMMPLYVIKEEIVFRGIIQNRLRKLGFWWMAIPISLSFAISHGQGELNVHVVSQVVSVFIGSFILIEFYEQTKNLWLAILLHLIYNVLIIFQIYLHVSRGWMEWIFWLVMLGCFVWAYKPIVKLLRQHKRRWERLHWIEYVFLAVFGIVLPLVLVLL